MSAIRSYEFELSRALLDILEERVPTCAFTLKGKSPRQVAEELDEANIYVWDGNYYALEVTTRLGLEESGGMVRMGLVPQIRWSTTWWKRSSSSGTLAGIAHTRW